MKQRRFKYILSMVILLNVHLAHATADRGLRIAACLQNQIKSARLPRVMDLKLNTLWSCQEVKFFKAYDADGSGDYAVIPLAEGVGIEDYQFAKEAWGYSNQALRTPAVGYYKIAEMNEIEGLLSIESGIKSGFLWDFIRVTPEGYLVSERSIINGDISEVSNPLAPPSLLDNEDRRAIAFRLCRPTPGILNVPWSTTTCFDIQ